MNDTLTHPADFLFAQKCLENDAAALRSLPGQYQETVTSFLVGRGADPREAHEVVGSLWADCVAGEGERLPKMCHYDGNCALGTWLKSVALNSYLNLKRRQLRWNTSELNEDAAGEDREPEEPILMEIMFRALKTAFRECPPEDFVLVQLAYMDGLRLTELAKLFGCSKSTIDRRLDLGMAAIREATLRHVSAVDRWLVLQWEDFIELCRVARPDFLGVE